MIMSEPLSIAQMLSSLSMRTLCANDQPYSPLPISRMNSPFGPNSSSCAAVGAYAGPLALLDRVKTKTCPFEFTATPGTSPKFMPAGSFRKSALESNGMSGTLCCCASTGTAASTNAVNRTVFIDPPSSGAYGIRLALVSRMRYLKHGLLMFFAAALLAPMTASADQGRGRGHAKEHGAAAKEEAIVIDRDGHRR